MLRRTIIITATFDIIATVVLLLALITVVESVGHSMANLAFIGIPMDDEEQITFIINIIIVEILIGNPVDLGVTMTLILGVTVIFLNVALVKVIVYYNCKLSSNQLLVTLVVVKRLSALLYRVYFYVKLKSNFRALML